MMNPGLPFQRTYRKMVEESSPFNRVHRLIDTFEEFSRFLTIISIRDFIAGRDMEEAESKNISSFLINRLYAPTLGMWHEFLYRTARYLAGSSSARGIFSEDVFTLLGYKQKLDASLEYFCRYKEKEYDIKNVQDAFGLFTEMRNDYAHGATPGDDICREHYRLFLPLLDGLLEKAGFLNGYTLETHEIDGVSRPMIRKDSGEMLSLYPFMLVLDGEFYYFNDARLKHKEKLTFLSYSAANKIIDSTSYQYLKEIFPEFDRDEDEVNLRRQRLLDTVIGRYEDAKHIENMVLKSPQSRVFYIFGDPGIGKSAMAVYLHEYYFNRCVKALHMFVHNEVFTLQPEAVFKSIAKPLTAEGLVPPMEINADNPAEIKKTMDMMLRQASEAAGIKKKTIVIIIDGLDEAYNISEHLYNILPFTPPPHVNIIYFSRRKDEIYSKIYRDSASWLMMDELKPLNRWAVRAILWQAISKYTINETVIDNVYKVSQGNPLYLRFLVTAILEKQIILASDTLLPRDIIEYYDRLILELVEQNPQLPIIETALVFSVCFEPLHQEQVKTILEEAAIENEISIGNIIISIKALSEIVRPVSSKGYQKRFQLFHKSIADFLEKQYSHTAKKIREAVLFSVVPGKQPRLKKWFYNFLEGGSILQERDEKNLSLLLKETGTFLSAYQILAHIISAHENNREIIHRCYEIAVSRQNIKIFTRQHLDIFYLVDDCFLKIYQLSPGRYIELVTGLNRRFPGDDHLKRHIFDALVLLRFSEEHYNTVIDMVIVYLLDYSGKMSKSKRLGHVHMINAIAGFARSPDTFVHLSNICSILMNTRPTGSIPAKKYEKMEKLLNHMARLLYCSSFNRVLARLRERDNTRFITRGDESYRGLILKTLGSLFKSPGVWVDTWRVGLRFIGLFLKNGIKIFLEFIMRLRIFSEIIRRSFPSVFTSHEGALVTPMGMLMITQGEEFVKNRFKTLKVKDYSVYDWLKRDILKGKSTRCANFSYLFSIILIPLSRALWRYSQTGRETLPRLSPEEREKVRKALRLLKAEEPITSEDEEMLSGLLSNDDAWENYFAMATIIIHGNTQFDKVERILKHLLDENPYNTGKSDEDSIIRRLKIFRKYFLVHIYLVRRALEAKDLPQMEKTLEYCLDQLYQELEKNPEMIPYFVKVDLFDKSRPFNPILPVGIYQGRTGDGPGGKDKLDEVIKRYLQLSIGQEEEIKIRLANKLFSDLVSLSVFYPGLALRTALRFYKDFSEKGSELLPVVIEKIYLIDLVMPGYLESAVNETGLKYDDIKKKLLEYKGADFSEPRVVKRMTEEIRVLVWHECLSTLTIFYHRIRDILLQAADECLKEELSLPLLIQRIVSKFLEAFFSSELDEKVENFFKSPGD
jgi:hypothetical protein